MMIQLPKESFLIAYIIETFGFSPDYIKEFLSTSGRYKYKDFYLSHQKEEYIGFKKYIDEIVVNLKENLVYIDLFVKH